VHLQFIIPAASEMLWVYPWQTDGYSLFILPVTSPGCAPAQSFGNLSSAGEMPLTPAGIVRTFFKLIVIPD
jgi:hypothetical protein